MRRSVVLCAAVCLALAACGKDDEQQASLPVDPVPVQETVSNAAPAPSEVAKQPSDQPKMVYTPVRREGPASLAQPVRPETLIVTQKFSCQNETKFVARFMHNPNQVEITFTGRQPVTLPAKRTGSGFLYETSAYKLVGKGNQAQWVMKNRTPVNCQIDR